MMPTFRFTLTNMLHATFWFAVSCAAGVELVRLATPHEAYEPYEEIRLPASFLIFYLSGYLAFGVLLNKSRKAYKVAAKIALGVVGFFAFLALTILVFGSLL
jgi:hypothetical protein